MSFFKTFLLGVGAAYGIQYITAKRANGRSILDDFLDNPKDFIEEKKTTVTEVIDAIKPANA